MEKRNLTRSILASLLFLFFFAASVNAQSYVSSTEASNRLKLEIRDTQPTTLQGKFKVKFMDAVAQGIRENHAVGQSVDDAYNRMLAAYAAQTQTIQTIRQEVQTLLEE